MPGRYVAPILVEEAAYFMWEHNDMLVYRIEDRIWERVKFEKSRTFLGRFR